MTDLIAQGIEGLAEQAQQRADSIEQLKRKLGKRRALHEAYRRLFDNEDESLRHSAALVLHDLAEQARFGRVPTPQSSEAELRFRDGQQAMFLHLMDRIGFSQRGLRQLARQIKENESE